jgi:hypothetical protein
MARPRGLSISKSCILNPRVRPLRYVGQGMNPTEADEMMTARDAVIMTALVLSGMASWMPVAQAGENSEAALRSQLEAVQQQLHELQFKVQRMESELGAAPTSTATPATVVPAAGSTPPPAPVMPVGSAATPIPPSTAVPVPAASSTVTPHTPPAPVRVEAATPSTTTAIPEAFQWRETLKTQWRSIKAGMSSEEIRKLLGTPTREFTLDGKPVWYFSYPGIGNGSVMFSRDGHTVAGWQHPPYGFW